MHSGHKVLFFNILFVIFGLSAPLKYNGHHLYARESWSAKKDLEHTARVNKVLIKVFYESLCPGSISFFVKELRPIVEQLSSYMDLHLVPFGFAKTRITASGRYTFQCHHGHNECFGNRVHACVVDELKNNSRAALVNACLMEYTDTMKTYRLGYASLINWCAHELNAPTRGILDCVYNGRSSILLKNHGEETRALKPQYVPYVQIFDSEGTPTEVTGDLMMDLCIKLNFKPSACHRYLQAIMFRHK